MGDLVGAPPRAFGKHSSVVVLMAEMTPVPLGTAACLLKSGSRDVSAGPVSHLKGTRSANVSEENVMLGEREALL